MGLKKAGLSAQEKSVIGITAYGHALCHFYELMLAAALMAIVRDFNTSVSAVTLIGTVGYFVFGLGAFPAGMWVSQVGPGLVLRAFFLLSGAASLWIGLSRGQGSFGAGLILLGLAGSCYHVSGTTLITQSVSMRGKALGIHGVAGSLGISLTPVIAGLILSVSGWRSIYLLASLLGFTGFIILLFKPVPVNRSLRQEPESVHEGFGRSSLVPFALMLSVMMINGLVYRGFMTMFPTFVSGKMTSGSPFAGGLTATLILSAGIIGQYVGGILSDRGSMLRLYFMTLALSMPFLFLLGFSQGFWIVPVGLFFVLFHFPQQPIENHMISRWLPPRWTGSGFGVKFTATFGMGAFAAGFTGMIADHYGIQSIFPVLAGLVFCSSALVFVLLMVLNKRSIRT